MKKQLLYGTVLAVCCLLALQAAAAAPAPAASRHPTRVSAPYSGRAGVDAAHSGGTQAVSLVADAAQPCAGTPEGQWNLARYSFCWRAGLTYNAYSVDTGLPVGEAHFTITQNDELPNPGTDWSETDTVTMDSAVGVTERGMLATWTANCTSNCHTTKAQPFAPATPIAEHEQLAGTVSFTDPQAAGALDAFHANYVLEMVSPGSRGDTPASWVTPDLRCDNQFSGLSAACVVEAFTPTFGVSRALYPAAAIGVQWALDNLGSHPGKQGSGQPLQRQANASQQRRNRSRICQKGWTPRLLEVLTDSCDEYPFAASRQGGSMDGPDCAEILPHVDLLGQPVVDPRGNPIIDVLHGPSASTTCSRAHIPLLQNTGVGGDLGRFVRSQRVLDNGPYWVAVT